MVEPKKITREDFEFQEILGRGAYGRVVKAQKIDSKETFAVKIVSKNLLKRVTSRKENKIKQAHAERDILAKLRNEPGVVKLHYTFQDPQYLYFVIELCSHGSFLSLITFYNSAIPLDLAKFYTAEIVHTICSLHQKSIAHRDLKPENLLISENYHLKLTDFGTAKVMSEEPCEELEAGSPTRRERADTFVGTAQ